MRTTRPHANIFEQAIKIDPNYARAYAGLSWTYELDYDFEWTDDDENTLKRALEIRQHGGAS